MGIWRRLVAGGNFEIWRAEYQRTASPDVLACMDKRHAHDECIRCGFYMGGSVDRFCSRCGDVWRGPWDEHGPW